MAKVGSGIYIIKNILDGKLYIGPAVNLAKSIRISWEKRKQDG